MAAAHGASLRLWAWGNFYGLGAYQDPSKLRGRGGWGGVSKKPTGWRRPAGEHNVTMRTSVPGASVIWDSS